MKKQMKKLVICGASIMHRSFELYGNLYRAKAELFNIGFKDVEFFTRALGGDTSTDLAGKIDSIVAEFSGQDDVVFFVHIGGNDVSATRPFDTATDTEKANLGNNLQYIVNTIESAGHTCIASSITYRTYPDVPPESNGSLPYNEQIVNPLIQASLPEFWDSSLGRPSFDLYTEIYNNQDWISNDWVHPTTAGEAGIRGYIFNRLADFFETTNVSLTSSIGTKYIIDLGRELVDQSVASINKVIGGDNQFQILKKTTGPKGSYVLVSDFNSSGSTGRGNAGDSTASLTNDELLQTFWYVGGSQTGLISVGGLADGCNGVISFTASRNTTDTDRIAEITVQGATKTLDAAANPPEIVSFDFAISGGQKSIDAYVKKQAGSSFAYISGAEIEFNEYVKPVVPVEPDLSLEPITLDEAKQQLRIESGFTLDDDYIASLITVARQRCEDYCNRFFTDYARSVYIEKEPTGFVSLPFSGMIINAIYYRDANGVLTYIPDDSFLSIPERKGIQFIDSFYSEGFTVEFNITIPSDISGVKQAMKIMVNDMYDLRTETVMGQSLAENQAVKSMLYPYRENLGI